MTSTVTAKTTIVNPLGIYDVILTITGNRLNDKLLGSRVLALVVQWLMRVSVTASTVYLAKNWLLASSTISMARLIDQSFVSCCFLHMLLFAWRRQRIRCFLQRISDLESEKSIRRISIVSCLIVVVSLSFQVTTTAVIVAQTFGDATAGIRMALLGTPLNINNFFIIYPLYYLLVIKILTLFQVKRLSLIRRSMMQALADDSGNTIQRLSWQMQECVAAMQSFEQLFNVIPFTGCAFLFIMVPGSVAQVREGTKAKKQFMADFQAVIGAIFHVVVITLILTIVRAACQAKQATSAAVKQVLQAIDQVSRDKAMTGDQRSLVRELSDFRDMPFTGLFLFTIDGSLVLSFLSSLISFSVLLCQLTASD